MSKGDFREIVRELRADISDDEFERMWASFIKVRELWRSRN